jgi:hypothetical protein
LKELKLKKEEKFEERFWVVGKINENKTNLIIIDNIFFIDNL